MRYEVIDRLRRPEYTGENRCLPCTVVNSIIALLLESVAALAWLPAAVFVSGVSAGAIYLSSRRESAVYGGSDPTSPPQTTF